MKRLTIPYINAISTNCPSVQTAITKLTDYENKEEQGLLFQFPCKIGDTVYKPVDHYFKGFQKINEPYILKFIVTKIIITENAITFDTKNEQGGLGDVFTLDDISKNVFLTELTAKEKFEKGEK